MGGGGGPQMNCFITISIYISELQICNFPYIQTKRMEFLVTVVQKQETIKHKEIRETARLRCLEDRNNGDTEEATHVY